MRLLKKNRLSFSILLLLLVSQFALTTFSSGSLPPSEKWFLITIADQPVGYIHEVSSRKNAGGGEVLLNTSDMKIVLNRLGSKVEMQFATEVEETGEGLLKKVGYDMRASLMSTRTEAVVKDKVIEFRTESGGKSYARTIQYSGTLLGQEGIRLLVAITA